MKRSLSPQRHAVLREKRLNVSEAKSKLSEILRELDDNPTIIHNRGRDVAVLVSVEDYERLVSEGSGSKAPTMRTFLQSIDVLKSSYDGGVELRTERVQLKARNPFARIRQ